MLSLLAVVLVDYRKIATYAGLLYSLTTSLLVIILIYGQMRKGAQRWLSVGSINVQPSEIAKVTLVLVLAKYVASVKARHLRFIDCDLRSIKAIQDAVRERAAKTPPGEWITGFKYDDTKTAERRFITREDLDAAAPQHPVYIGHRGGHTATRNLGAREGRHHRQSPDPGAASSSATIES
jgi:hypothetical protein